MDDEIIKEMQNAFKADKSFVLVGGAGSGKTHSLKELVNQIYSNQACAKVACITYTDVAAEEIKKRCLNTERTNVLQVSTIHSFLWQNIKNFQPGLKRVLIDLLIDGHIRKDDDIELDELTHLLKDKDVDYKNYRKISDGVISHDDLLKIFAKMLESYPLLSRIFADRYDYILVDEYQDTSPDVINGFIELIKKKCKTKFGFFGDTMQAIYSNGIGDLNEYIADGTLEKIEKQDNYRCSMAAIELCNKIRNDGLIQCAAHLDNNGHVDNKPGRAIFVYSNSCLDDFRKTDVYNEIFENKSPDKEMYLTNRLVAKSAKFGELLAAYTSKETYGQSGKERLIGTNKDKLAAHLSHMAKLVYLYNHRVFDEFIQAVSIKVECHNDKRKLKGKMETFLEKNMSVETAINSMNELGLLHVSDEVQEFPILYNKVKNIAFSEALALYEYENKHTPFSTQHGVKGDEFNNVLVVLDNGQWNIYDFNELFSDNPPANVLKLFYVCISRTANNVAVFMKEPPESIINKAKQWFGNDNVISV